MISLLTKKAHQGGVLGIHQSVSSISRILGPALGGWIYGKWGYQILFIFAGGVVGVGFILALLFGKWLPNTSKKKDSPMEDYGSIQSFQLDNLIQNQVPFSLFYLPQTKNAREAISSSVQNLLKLSQSITEKDLLTRSPGNLPVVLICEDGRLSKNLSLKLLKKWTNVFYLEGGLLKYKQEKDS